MADAPKRISTGNPLTGEVAEYTRADLIDMDVLRSVEDALKSRCETYIAAGGVPLDDDVIHQLETNALVSLRAMMEKINE